MAKKVNIAPLRLDKKEFEKIFEDYYSQLCAFAFSFMNDMEDAEEIVQNVYVHLWENRKSINFVP